MYKLSILFVGEIAALIFGLSGHAAASPCTSVKQRVPLTYRSFEQCVDQAETNLSNAAEPSVCAAELGDFISAATKYAQCATKTQKSSTTKDGAQVSRACADCSHCHALRIQAASRLLNCALKWRFVEDVKDLPSGDCEAERAGFAKTLTCQ